MQINVNNCDWLDWNTSSFSINSTGGRYDRLTTVVQTTLIAVISSAIILSNIINLIVLLSASAAMPWATRLFLINLSSSDLLVGVVACAPSVLPAATHRWTYRHTPTWPTWSTCLAQVIYMHRWTYGDVWCQVSGVVHGTSCAVSIWSIAMVGLHRFDTILSYNFIKYRPVQ